MLIPISFLFEYCLQGRTYSRRVLASIPVILLGVGLATVSDVVSVNPLGFLAAAFAVLSASAHQVSMKTLQMKYKLAPRRGLPALPCALSSAWRLPRHP